MFTVFDFLIFTFLFMPLVMLFTIALIILPFIIGTSLTLRLIMMVFRFTFARCKIVGKENIPSTGACILVSNHVSLADFLLIQSLTKRKVTFMVREKIFNFMLIGVILRSLGVIAVPSSNKAKAMCNFFEDVKKRLRNGEVLCMFPEGGISGNGCLMRFRSGVSHFIDEKTNATIIPLRIGVMGGRIFLPNLKFPYFKISPIFPPTLPLSFNVKVGEKIDAKMSSFELQQHISELGAEMELSNLYKEKPLHTEFIYQAKKYPFKTVYLDAIGKRVSNFSQLVRSLIIAQKIRELPNWNDSNYIGILLPNGSITAAVTLAVHYSDKTPAMLNYSAGSKTVLECAKRANIKHIISSHKFIEKIKWDVEDEKSFIYAEDFTKTITKSDKIKTILKVIFMPSKLLAKKVAPKSAFDLTKSAVLLFSSGSTGVPKAIELTFKNISSNIASFWRVIDWRRKDIIAGNLPLFHAYGFTVGFGLPAISGTRVVYILNPLDNNTIIKAIKEFKISVLTTTPTFLQKLIKGAKDKDFNSLRLVITGAEKLREELIKSFHNLTKLEIVEGYGCTELSPIVSINLCNDIKLLGKHSDHVGSIGIALPGIHVRIVDEDNKLLEPNISGRMQVKGALVMKGYLNDAETTNKVLKNGYYDTGDIAKMDKDGYIYITGRASRFSKIGGEMVSHELVEQSIMKFRKREEREIAITTVPDNKKGERLIVLYTSDDFEIDEVIKDLRTQGLSNISIPKREDFVWIEKLPLLGSGKLDLVKLNKIAKDLFLNNIDNKKETV